MPYWIAAAITAVVSIAYASAFRWSEQIAFQYLGESQWIVFLVVPLAILMSALMAEFLAPAAAGSGIPQLIAAMELARRQHGFVEKLRGGAERPLIRRCPNGETRTGSTCHPALNS